MRLLNKKRKKTIGFYFNFISSVTYGFSSMALRTLLVLSGVTSVIGRPERCLSSKLWWPFLNLLKNVSLLHNVVLEEVQKLLASYGMFSHSLPAIDEFEHKSDNSILKNFFLIGVFIKLL